LREVGIRQGISLKYLEQIASLLTHAGYLKSMRGAQGGYTLAQSAASITAGDIMRAAEGGFLPVSCLDEDTVACPRQGTTCQGPWAFWTGLRDAIDEYIDSVNIEQLSRQCPAL
jgi:Rrf2 family protein